MKVKQKKIKNLNQLSSIVRRLKSKNKKIVFTNGCFDLLHLGHIQYLAAAKKKGGVLIVGLNSDSSIKKLKGINRPIFPQSARAGVLAGLESVDYLTIFNELTPLKVIQRLRPDILVKGGDWKAKQVVGKDFVELYGGRVITIPFIKGYSTRLTIRTIVRRYS